MKEALEKLNQEQIEFICKECGLTKETLMAMDNDELYDSVYETMCDIEISEPNECDNRERYDTASDIVTLLGNTLEQYDDEGEDD